MTWPQIAAVGAVILVWLVKTGRLAWPKAVSTVAGLVTPVAPAAEVVLKAAVPYKLTPAPTMTVEELAAQPIDNLRIAFAIASKREAEWQVAKQIAEGAHQQTIDVFMHPFLAANAAVTSAAGYPAR